MNKILDDSNCSDIAEKLMPIVNFNNCGGKEDCVAVCPYAVFEMQPITKEDKGQLNFPPWSVSHRPEQN